MIRYKGQSSQAKHEHYPSIIILVSFVKTLKTANPNENVAVPKPNA